MLNLRTAGPAHIAASVLALAVALAGCGGGHATAPSTSSPPHRAGPPRATAGRACAAQAAGDPARLGLCLARHGIVVPSGGRLTSCVESAPDRAHVAACLARYADAGTGRS
jgi:hypothetical protein